MERAVRTNEKGDPPDNVARRLSSSLNPIPNYFDRLLAPEGGSQRIQDTITSIENIF